MKHFFRFLLLAVAVMACSVETKAQDNDKQRMTPEERVERKEAGDECFCAWGGSKQG